MLVLQLVLMTIILRRVYVTLMEISAGTLTDMPVNGLLRIHMGELPIALAPVGPIVLERTLATCYKLMNLLNAMVPLLPALVTTPVMCLVTLLTEWESIMTRTSL